MATVAVLAAAPALAADQPEMTPIIAQPPTIAYRVDRAAWEARTAKRLRANPELLNVALPDGFPTKLESPLVWEGEDFGGDESKWVYQLNTEQLKEVDDAVKHFHCTWATSRSWEGGGGGGIAK